MIINSNCLNVGVCKVAINKLLVSKGFSDESIVDVEKIERYKVTVSCKEIVYDESVLISIKGELQKVLGFPVELSFKVI